MSTLDERANFERRDVDELAMYKILNINLSIFDPDNFDD